MKKLTEIICKRIYGDVDNKPVIINFCTEVSRAEQD